MCLTIGQAWQWKCLLKVKWKCWESRIVLMVTVFIQSLSRALRLAKVQFMFRNKWLPFAAVLFSINCSSQIVALFVRVLPWWVKCKIKLLIEYVSIHGFLYCDVVDPPRHNARPLQVPPVESECKHHLADDTTPRTSTWCAYWFRYGYRKNSTYNYRVDCAVAQSKPEATGGQRWSLYDVGAAVISGILNSCKWFVCRVTVYYQRHLVFCQRLML